MPGSPQLASSVSGDAPYAVSYGALPADLNLFHRHGPNTEVSNDSAEFILTAFGAIHVFNQNNDPSERPETIESKAHPTFSELTNLVIWAL